MCDGPTGPDFRCRWIAADTTTRVPERFSRSLRPPVPGVYSSIVGRFKKSPSQLPLSQHDKPPMQTGPTKRGPSLSVRYISPPWPGSEKESPTHRMGDTTAARPEISCHKVSTMEDLVRYQGRSCIVPMDLAPAARDQDCIVGPSHIAATRAEHEQSVNYSHTAASWERSERSALDTSAWEGSGRTRIWPSRWSSTRFLRWAPLAGGYKKNAARGLGRADSSIFNDCAHEEDRGAWKGGDHGLAAMARMKALRTTHRASQRIRSTLDVHEG